MFRATIPYLLLVAVLGVGPSAQTEPEGQPAPPSADARTDRARPAPQALKWWQADKTRAELGLSTDQSAKIEEIWQAATPRLRSTFDDVARLEKQLSKLMSSNDATEMDVVRQLNQVQAARNEADRQRTLMFFRMQRILTFDQRMKLNALRQRLDQERRGGRRGDQPPAQPLTAKK